MARGPAEATRARILDAATTRFAGRGFSGASVRDIAGDAGVDPALVIRHFGTKEQLFLEAVRVRIGTDPLRDVPLEDLGRQFVAFLLDAEDGVRAAWLALVRGSAEPAIGHRLRTVHDELFVEPLRDRLEGPGADERARLAAALVGGLLYSMWVVGDEALLLADRADVVDRYGALLQRLVTP